MQPFDLQPHPTIPGAQVVSFGGGPPMMVTGQAAQNLQARKERMGTTQVEHVRPEDEAPGLGTTLALGAAAPFLPAIAPAVAAYKGAKSLLADKDYQPRAAPQAETAPAQAPEPETQQASAVTPQGAPAAQTPAAAPAQASGPTPLGYTMKGVDPATGKEIAGQAIRDADGSIKIYVPGSPGRAGGLTTLGKEALQHENAAEAELTKQRGLEEQARQVGIDAAKQEASEREAYLDEQRVQQMLQIQQQQDEQAKVQQRVTELQGKYDKARDDFMTSKVDPDAYMKSGGGSTAIFSTLGMMLGAFGSTLARTPNFAQEFVNGQINRHIQAQEAQIQIKGKAADNMLADLTRETGSLQNGKLAMRQLLLEKASTEAQQIGARSKSQAVQAESDKTAAALAGQAAIADNMRKQGFLEHVMSSPIYYQRGSAGRTAGFITPTLDQVGTLQGQQLKARDQALQEEKLGVEKSKAAGGSAVSPERSGNINAAGEAIQAAMNIRSELEGRKVQGDAYDDPTRGLLDKVGNSQSNENINQNTTVLAKGVQSAFGKSDRDAADAEKMAAGGGSGRDRYQAAERIEKRLVGSIRTELTTLPPVQQKQLLDTLPADVRARVLGQ